MKTCIISFSSRAAGNCSQVGKLVYSLTKDAILFDFSEFDIHPCGKCGYECFATCEKCPYIDDMECSILDAITHSDLTYFILPNYCDYPCANFFAFNERSQCYFQGKTELLDAYEKVPKRAIIVSNTNEKNFRKVMAYHVDREPEILFLSAKKYGKVSIKGNLLTSEQALADVMEFVKDAAE